MYKSFDAEGTFPEPDWLKLTQGKSVEELFGDRFQRSTSPARKPGDLIQKLRGAK